MSPPEMGPPTEADSNKSLSNQFLGQIGLPAFIISTFFPHLMHKLANYPKLMRLLSLPFAVWIGWEFLSTKLISLWSKLMSTCMSSICVYSEDSRLHASVCRLLHNKKLMMTHRAMSAASYQHLRNEGGGYYHTRRFSPGSIIFDPQNKFQFFWHDGRLFVLTVERNTPHLHTSDLTIWTFGWSPEPIRKMLVEAHADSTKEEGRIMTSIYVPNSGNHWTHRSAKPRRPLESVYLADGQKQTLLQDMGEYLDDKTVRWYEDRGIPHRRGYMFHGKPGTGKTTLAMALAGQFKLSVYMLSLLDKDVTDSSLLQLFQSITRGTLILLEDVDCAGIEKRGKTRTKRLPKRKKKSQINGEDTEGSNVTLSGLLNAIDGAGAPEGHVLIMSSNNPDVLDPALVRAGRVDVWVEFRNATRVQLRDIFINMYHPAAKKDQDSFHLSKVDASDRSSGDTKESNPAQEAEKRKTEETRVKVHALAEKFADSVPEDRFSPAELQDYIVMYKNKPEAAVDNVGKWVAEKLGEQARDETPDDSDAEDNVFTEDQSERSTAASSADNLSGSSLIEVATKQRSGKGETEVDDKAALDATVIDLATRLKALDPQQLAAMLGRARSSSEGDGSANNDVPVPA